MYTDPRDSVRATGWRRLVIESDFAHRFSQAETRILVHPRAPQAITPRPLSILALLAMKIFFPRPVIYERDLILLLASDIVIYVYVNISSAR